MTTLSPDAAIVSPTAAPATLTLLLREYIRERLLWWTERGLHIEFGEETRPGVFGWLAAVPAEDGAPLWGPLNTAAVVRGTVWVESRTVYSVTGEEPHEALAVCWRVPAQPASTPLGEQAGDAAVMPVLRYAHEVQPA